MTFQRTQQCFACHQHNEDGTSLKLFLTSCECLSSSFGFRIRFILLTGSVGTDESHITEQEIS